MKTTISILFSVCVITASTVSAMPGMGKKGAPPAGHGTAESGASVPAVDTIKGKALDVIQAGSYTYVEIQKGKKSVWAAVPRTEIKKGTVVEIYAGMEMPNFRSKSLNRTFENILFSNGVVGKKVDSAKSGKSAAVATGPIKVKKAKGPGARTVSEVYKMKKELAGKKVLVRGKVVKVSEKVMGKNWVHIQDGTGSAKSGDHDLLITTQETPEKDSVVTFSGPIVLDKDFGSGYSYAVLMEKAVLKP